MALSSHARASFRASTISVRVIIHSITEGVHESIESNWIKAKVERTIDGRADSCRFMGEGARVNVAVADRILLHLLNHISQVDLHTVTSEITRRGISIACAVHPPNVSRSMRDLVATGIVAQGTRSVRGENRRQKVWYLTSLGIEMATAVKERLSEIPVLVRSRNGDLLELPASEASDRLRADLDLLSVLMHAQHEGALSYGDIRFGPIRNKTIEPGSIKMMAGAHSTYHTEPPKTRDIHGRNEERKSLDLWFSGTEGICTITGVAGCGKTTLVSDWFRTCDSEIEDMLVMYYPCQPWDTAIGLTTSIFHRLGLGQKNGVGDPYDLISILPPPGNPLDHDLLRRRLTATLIDEDELIGNKSKLFLILDDVHNLDRDGVRLLGVLMQVIEASHSRMIVISRSSPDFYDRRDVVTRGRVSEIALGGLSRNELEMWVESMGLSNKISTEILHERTGGHPLAIELLEMYGEMNHRDWVRFLDSEIVDVLPDEDRSILMALSKAKRPVPWKDLSESVGYIGRPPKSLISRGLMIELEDGMWLHEALRSRLRMYTEKQD